MQLGRMTECEWELYSILKYNLLIYLVIETISLGKSQLTFDFLDIHLH